MKKRFAWFTVLLLVLLSVLPVTAQAASATPEEQLRTAIHNLVSPYTQTINDPKYDVKKLSETIDQSAVSVWKYAGKSGKQIILEWTFEWQDDFAVLRAYEDPSLVRKLNPRQKTLYRKSVEVFTALIQPGMTDFEKELAIHDYLVTHYEYDHTALASPETADPDVFTAYGALINERAVCQGYTNAAALLLSMAGIENYRPESDTHIWNLVKLGDGYYHMDVSWDGDLTALTGKPAYAYTNLTDKQMGRYDQHNWINREKLPKAVAETYHYYKSKGLAASSPAEIEKIISAAVSRGETNITLWINNHLHYPYNWERDLKFMNFLRTGGQALNGYYYVLPDGSRDTLTIIFD